MSTPLPAGTRVRVILPLADVRDHDGRSVVPGAVVAPDPAWAGYYVVRLDRPVDVTLPGGGTAPRDEVCVPIFNLAVDP